MLVPLTVLLVLILCATASEDLLHPLSDEFIENINSMQSTWTAGRNFNKKTSLKYIYRLMGTYHSDDLNTLPQRRYTIKKKFPKNFDAREKWPSCPTLNDIRDQGACGSCWAVAAVSAMTDRFCISSNGKKNFYFSAEDVLSCCNCGTCEGGILHKAWEYYKHNGTVSGGNYNSSQGCKPYEIPPCEHNAARGRGRTQTKCDITINPPACIKKCNENYNVQYDKDIHHGSLIYRVNRRGISYDIFYHGPVTSYFDVYEDFIHYKSGIYKRTSGDFVGTHSVKLIGWGKEGNVKYWLAVNSWGSDWGENGFFKIIRNNEYGGCGIENHVVSGK